MKRQVFSFFLVFFTQTLSKYNPENLYGAPHKHAYYLISFETNIFGDLKKDKKIGHQKSSFLYFFIHFTQKFTIIKPLNIVKFELKTEL